MLSWIAAIQNTASVESTIGGIVAGDEYFANG